MQKSARSRTTARVTAGALAVLFAAGCSASLGSKEVSRGEVEKQASAALSKQISGKIDDLTCEDDLKAEVGETVRCELTVDGAKQGMTVTAKSVDGDKVKMGYKVDDAPAAGGSAEPASSPPARPTDAASTGTGGGTGGSTGGESVPRAEVARQGKAALAAQAGRQPDAFSCPQDLPARVNAVIRCQLSADGSQYGVTVTATSVVDGKVNMSFKVDQTPNG
ncbi:DUF4333 domain-containing protein [Streptomyces sp. CWNU-52B]|uniref:DUF4333 domain-containing protein n=1 Tax=unclassified Streptomyces TaxID=2593676 RepID=UPI0039C487B0